MNTFVFISLLILLTLCSKAQQISHVYEESDEDIVNPERGFYTPTGTKASNYVLLDVKQLKDYRSTPQQLQGALYKVQVSLIYRGYELDIFKNTPLSDSFLLNLQKDFDAVRTAGLKMILRFAYTNTAKGGDCKDEYKICPPYGDAPRHVVLQHIQQLKPLFQKNADVIAVLQEGFIGIWGENYFTDYFGDASTNGLGVIADSSWRHRTQLLNSLLDAMPQSRMVQVRTPQIKQKAVYGPSAPVTVAPLMMTEAFTASPKARIGFHNDCLLSTPDDYGTYYDYGSSTQGRQPANEALRRYIEADTKYTVVGGETCDDAYSPQNDCAPSGFAEAELRRMHYSYLNAGYNTAVNNDWDSVGCMKNVRRHLGYRLVLKKALLPKKTRLGSMITLDVLLDNLGYASPFNPRPFLLVLRNKKTGAEYFLPLKKDVRTLFSGSHRITEKLRLPNHLTKGNYEVFFSLPDADNRLQTRPEYSIRFANKSLWEAETGYNNLHHTITIE